ncbi:MAG TPA: hypothetical protein VL614_00735 [Acetobacteraceae bacterium]|jgi:hypothetical protein|nr:hypothetical protein [Acetobacteraceae bacterium]
MRALIMLVSDDLLGRIERCVAPEHRVRAQRSLTDTRLVELIVEGPMLPEVVEGLIKRGDIELTMHTDEDDSVIWLEACWRIFEPGETVRSATWEVGRWQSLPEMMEFMR